MFRLLYTNYLIAYDIDRHRIRAFPIPELERPYLLKSTFVPSEDLIEKLQAFWEDLLGNTDRIVELGEDYEDRQRPKRRG